jgi:Pyruvate/2-oxoacid:ferredoxin oxidoreductase delta subunit
VAVVDDGKCIRCYCCHELCPEAAIELKFSWMGRLMRWSGAMGLPVR